MVWTSCEVCDGKIVDGDDVVVLKTGKARFGFWASMYGTGRVGVTGDAVHGAIHRKCAYVAAADSIDVSQDAARLLDHLAREAGSDG